jgi:hypothetical protein
MKQTFLPLILAAITCAAVWSASADETPDRESAERSARAALRLVLYLASDVRSEEIRAREEAIALLYKQVLDSELERALAENLSNVNPTSEFNALIASSGTQPADYLSAARRSYARLNGAERATDREWAAKHMSAARKYAALAVQGLNAQAKLDEAALAKLQQEPFAVRRPTERATAFLEQIKRDGLSAEHRTLLQESALSAEEIDGYQKQLLATPVGELGISMVELYQQIVETRRALAVSLDQFAAAGFTESGPLSQTFTLANPHDRAVTIEVFIRRASIPPDWKLSLVNADDPSGDKSGPRPQEIEAGKHYRVTLPAKGQIKVASVVEPVGVLAENTTARWAVEGYIGDELLGGIVHEMHVPGFLPDLKLPEIGAVDTPTTDNPPTETTGFQWHVSWVIAGVSLLLGAIAFLFWCRRHART